MSGEAYRILQDYAGHACWTDHGFAKACEFVDQLRNDQSLIAFVNARLAQSGYSQIDIGYGDTCSIMRAYASACSAYGQEELSALCSYIDDQGLAYNLSGFLDEALTTDGL